MKRRNFLVSLPVSCAVACNPRMEKRAKRYDEKQCPFCIVNPGVCSYCRGSGKCGYCGGTGKRKTSTMNYPDRKIEQVVYEEECPFCKGSGACRYCDGVGKCWACSGTGRIDDWNFYERAQAEERRKQSDAAGPEQEAEKEKPATPADSSAGE